MCTDRCGRSPPERSRRTTALGAVEPPGGGSLGRAEEAEGADQTRGRESSPGAGGEQPCLQSGGEIVRFI